MLEAQLAIGHVAKRLPSRAEAFTIHNKTAASWAMAPGGHGLKGSAAKRFSATAIVLPYSKEDNKCRGPYGIVSSYETRGKS